MEALTLFLWGENLEHVRVFGRSGWFKKCLGVLSLLSYRVKISFKLALGVSD
ncbi:hypothetical protein ACPDJQ_06765 [Helicobacter pylori]|uniref:hypothetical protein n=1 Tax=Helicobacter pylori TaxID=210 RepID=UPI003DA8BBAE